MIGSGGAIFLATMSGSFWNGMFSAPPKSYVVISYIASTRDSDADNVRV